MVSVFVCRKQWCQCVFAGIIDINVCLQESVVGSVPSVWVSKVVSVFVCRAQESVVAGVGPSAWIQQNCVNVFMQESVFVSRCQHLQESVVVGGGPPAWVQRGGVSVCLQESMVLMFVCRNQWCQSLWKSMVLTFVCRNQWC